MVFDDFRESASRLMQTLTRPDWKQYWLSTKIVFAGIGLIGAIGFLIKVLSVTLQSAG